MEKKDYKEYSDELLVRMARDGDEKAEDFLLKNIRILSVQRQGRISLSGVTAMTLFRRA